MKKMAIFWVLTGSCALLVPYLNAYAQADEATATVVDKQSAVDKPVQETQQEAETKGVVLPHPVGAPKAGEAKGPTEGEKQAAVSKLAESRKKIEQLVKERNDLMQKGAPEEEVRKKMDQIMEEQRSAVKQLQIAFPQGLPPMSKPQSFDINKLPASEQSELKYLLGKRKEMVDKGATHKEVEALTKRIQEITNRPQPGMGQSVPPIPPFRMPPKAQGEIQSTPPTQPPAEAMPQAPVAPPLGLPQASESKKN